MFEKLLNTVLYLTDLFDRHRRSWDPVLDEKRARERRMVIAVAAVAGCFLFVFAFDPVAPLETPKTTTQIAGVIRTVVSLMFATGGGLAFIWSLIEMVAYWRFRARVGLD